MQRPNILLIMDDQHRYDWLGCNGANWLHTPHLDALAARGLQFSRCYTNAPLCVPARIALATGLLPTRTGMVDNKGFLAPHMKTYYQRLRDAGYRVGCVGKLHMNHRSDPQAAKGNRPVSYTWGFTDPEEHEGKCEAGLTANPTGPYTHMLAEHGLLQDFHQDYLHRQALGWHRANEDSLLPTELYQDYWTGSRAVTWLETVRTDRPWHLFVSFGGPHDPFDPPTEFANRYRNKDIPGPIMDSLREKPQLQQRHQQFRPYFPEDSTSLDRDASNQLEDPDTVLSCQRQYAACTEVIDHRVGALLQVLEQRGMLDNTIIFFTSDHGEMLGDHGLWRKRIMYESAIHIPLIVAGPGINPGHSDALIELADLNPTICELAGLPPQEMIDAHSFARVLAGSSHKHRDYVCSFLWPYLACVRTSQYKLVRTINDRFELYDLEADPDELSNLYDEQLDLRRDLNYLLHQRWLSWGGKYE